MKRRLLLTMILGSVLIWQAPAMAGEVDILVDKLVQHGVLSQKDAQEILKETKVEAEKERRETVAATRDALMTGKDAPFALASAIPSFITNTKFKGDLRLRYEYSDRDDDGKDSRNRGRYRFRLGMETKVNDKVNVGFALASGGSDPRSTNQSFGNSFETPDIRLDMAYATYKPFDWLQLVGGQFENPLWCPSGWLWDGDIRPQGVSASMNHKVGGVELFMNNGFWILDELSSSSEDPMMAVVQPGYKIKLGDNAYFKNAFAYYNFIDVEDAELDYSAGTNTTNPDDTLSDDYDAFVVSGELGFKTGIKPMPFAALYGEYVKNTATSESEDTGYSAGIKFGHEKVKDPGQWQIATYYEKLEQDAWLDIFPDSDAYGGATNIKSYVAKATYGLMKNVELGAAYYRSKQIDGPSNDEDLLQVDMVFKF